MVEDEVKMAALLRRGLGEQGLTVDIAGEGERAVEMAGAAALRRGRARRDAARDRRLRDLPALRRDGVWAPILMLTARGAIGDRVNGLDDGADDYMVKPFAFAELLARLRALVRRGTVERPASLEVGALRLDPGTREVWRGEAEIELSAKEFALLETFMRHPGSVLTRTQLLEQGWDFDFEHRSNVIEVYVRYLRRKIDVPFGTDSIETVRGAGYRLRKDGGA